MFVSRLSIEQNKNSFEVLAGRYKYILPPVGTLLRKKVKISFVFATRCRNCCPNVYTLNGENPPVYSTCKHKQHTAYGSYDSYTACACTL